MGNTKGTNSLRRASLEPLENRVLFAAGDLDPTFGGGDGRVLLYANAGLPGDVVALPNGKVLMAGGIASADADASMAGLKVTRLNADGSVDTSFGGGDGVAFIPRAGVASSTALAVQPDGRIVVAGALDDSSVFVVGRFNSDGSPDNPFGWAGNATEIVNFGPFSRRRPSNFEQTIAAEVAIAPDGDILVAGTDVLFDSASTDTRSRFAVGRLTPDGHADLSFTGDGGATFLESPQYGTAVGGAAVQPDGRVVLGGTWIRGGRFTGAAVRLKTDGTLDPTFGGDGIATLSKNAYTNANVNLKATGVALAPGGSVILGGGTELSFPATSNNLFAARLNPDGSLDSTYGGAPAGGVPGVKGVALAPVGKVGSGDVTGDVVADGDVVYVSGTATQGGNDDFAIARFTRAGAPDATFGDNGVVVTDFASEPPAAPGSSDAAMHLALAPGGRLLALGRSGRGTELDTAIARYVLTQPPPGPGDGGTVYEAENASFTGAVIVGRSHSGYTGTGYADYGNTTGDSVEFKPRVSTTGNYTLEFRFANGSGLSRPMVLVNNSTGAETRVNFPTTGSWSTWKTVTVPTVLLAAGNSLTLRADGNSGPNLDSLTVRPAQSLGVKQAEDATVVGAFVSRENAGYTGSGYVDFFHNTGDYIEWTLDVPERRDYTLVFRYANGGSTARQLELSLNGNPVNRITFNPTGSWKTWNTVTYPVGFDGPSTGRIRLTAVGTAGPNIDSLTIL